MSSTSFFRTLARFPLSGRVRSASEPLFSSVAFVSFRPLVPFLSLKVDSRRASARGLEPVEGVEDGPGGRLQGVALEDDRTVEHGPLPAHPGAQDGQEPLGVRDRDLLNALQDEGRVLVERAGQGLEGRPPGAEEPPAGRVGVPDAGRMALARHLELDRDLDIPAALGRAADSHEPHPAALRFAPWGFHPAVTLQPLCREMVIVAGLEAVPAEGFPAVGLAAVGVPLDPDQAVVDLEAETGEQGRLHVAGHLAGGGRIGDPDADPVDPLRPLVDRDVQHPLELIQDLADTAPLSVRVRHRRPRFTSSTPPRLLQGGHLV